jgi:hypothetical protein
MAKVCLLRNVVPAVVLADLAAVAHLPRAVPVARPELHAAVVADVAVAVVVVELAAAAAQVAAPPVAARLARPTKQP